MKTKKCIKCNKRRLVKFFNKRITSKDGFRNSCKTCETAQCKKYYLANQSKIASWKNKNKIKITKQINDRYKNDINYRIKHNLRTRFNLAIKNNSKKSSIINLLGCSIPKFKEYIEKQFIDDMTWNNYGQWHIDHIKPCCGFDLSDKKQQQICFHYTNSVFLCL